MTPPLTLKDVLETSLTLPISGIACDSRKVQPGQVFFALSGKQDEGLRHVQEALSRGACAIVAEHKPEGLGNTAFVHVADARLALAKAASHFYPQRPEICIDVTGTSGKTSVVTFVRQILAQMGKEAASLGTLGVISRLWTQAGSLTTPDPIVLHQTLARLAKAGVTHLALEASSHGLDQKRLDGIVPHAVGFTNLSRDHLDYHATMEAYLDAKLRLVRELLPRGSLAIVDADTPIASQVIAAVQEAGRVPFTIGRGGEDLRLVSAEREGYATRLRIHYAGRDYEGILPLPGDFQVANALVAAGLCLACECAPETVFATLARLEGVPGRLQRVGDKEGAPLFVDYAHKPDALAKVLATLRPFVTGRLIIVLGCGGDRDPGKRSLMGQIAARDADIVIVTDDNPRSEDPAHIRAAILQGCPEAREIGDRAEAISEAISLARSGDAVIIAGKGHETGQIIGDHILPFSDVAVAQEILESLRS